MPNERSMPPDAAGGSRRSTWFWILVIVLIFGVTWWQNRQPTVEEPTRQFPDSGAVEPSTSSASSESLPDPDEPQHAPVSSDREHSGGSDSASVSHRSSTGPLADRRHGTKRHVSPDDASDRDSNPNPQAENRSEHSVRIENQTIRDLNGNVAYKGTIDLTPTLDRIERGEANRHRNDGTTFQNREGRLPRKPAGYYKEYVHPTPGEQGPGPQRVIVGQEGEIWYTPDHYKSFREIRPAKQANRREQGPNPNDLQ